MTDKSAGRWLTEDEAEQLGELLGKLSGEMAAIRRREVDAPVSVLVSATRKNYWQFLQRRYFDQEDP